MQKPAPVVAKYYLYSATQSHGFVVPVAVQYLVGYRGLSFSALGTTGAAFMLGWALGEVPTGYVGDRIGRRNSLLVSSTLTALALAMLAFGRTLPVFVAAYLVWSLGVTFRSGAGSAWLYETLEERLAAEEFTRVKGRGWAVRLVVTATASVAGSALAAADWRYPFAANVALVSLSVPVLLSMPKAGRFEEAGAEQSGADDSQDDDPEVTFRAVLGVVRERFATPELRGFVVYMALFFGLVEVVLSYVQPVSTGLGLPVAWLGWLYAGLSLAAAGAGYVAEDVRERVGERGWFLAAPLAMAATLLVAAAVPVAAFGAFFVVRVVRSVTTTLRGQYLNDRVGDVGRATALSAASMLFSLTAAVTRQVGGILADATSPLTMYAAFASAFVVATVLLVRVAPPVGTPPAGSAAASD